MTKNGMRPQQIRTAWTLHRPTLLCQGGVVAGAWRLIEAAGNPMVWPV